MNAIYRGEPFSVESDDGDGVNLHAIYSSVYSVYVKYGNKTLIIDPTDDQWDAALRGDLPANYTGNNLSEALHEAASLTEGKPALQERLAELVEEWINER